MMFIETIETAACSYIILSYPQWNSYWKNVIFEFLHADIFCCTLDKEVSFWLQSYVMFRHKIVYMINSFSVSATISAINNILQKLIQILLWKILGVINLHSFGHHTSEKITKKLFQVNLNNRIEVCHTSCQMNFSW